MTLPNKLDTKLRAKFGSTRNTGARFPASGCTGTARLDVARGVRGVLPEACGARLSPGGEETFVTTGGEGFGICILGVWERLQLEFRSIVPRTGQYF
jgi:hypothetical protein